MKLTVEISMYPFAENYIEPISWFISRLDNYPTVKRVTNAMSTQLCGEYETVMQLLTVEMQAAHEKFGKAVFVCKFIGGELDLEYRD